MLAAIDAGAEDVARDGAQWRVVTPPSDVHTVADALDGSRHRGRVSRPDDAAAARRSHLTDAEEVRPVLRVLDALDDHDDVQAVHANADISDELLAGLEV